MHIFLKWLKRLILGFVILVMLLLVALLIFAPTNSPQALLHAVFGMGIDTPDKTKIEQRLSLPEGFTLGVYVRDIPKVRFMEFSEKGDLLVTLPREGKVLLFEKGDTVAGSQHLLLDNLNRPHGLDIHDGWLYVAESTAVGRISFDAKTGTVSGDYQHIITGLADEGNHWSKTIRFGPDGKLYLSSGSTCNVCIEEDEQRATIMRSNADGSDFEIYATGLRNSVGFDWSETTGELFATDNGRDLLGDDFPPCELNKIEQGGFYGWPYINGFGDLDPDYGDEQLLDKAIDPVHGFRAHNAPLGIRFANIAWPQFYEDSALVALHGSLNRSIADGYKVVSLHRQADGSFVEEDFLSGFEKDGDIIGRPVDVAIGIDDCAYVSDDYAGAIYRVCYQKPQSFSSLSASSNDGASENERSHQGMAKSVSSEQQAINQHGEKLFKQNMCMSCHTLSDRKKALGSVVLKNLNQRYSQQQLVDFFKTPTAPMPPVQLSEADQIALAAYLLSLPES